MVRVGQGGRGLGATLPIVPPIQEDELISSWLNRIARFYGHSIQSMMLGIGPASRIELSELDLGVPRTALKPIAVLLQTGVSQLASRTMTASWPNALGLVARGAYVPHGCRQPRLRYSACPQCLEEQRITLGASWLRRSWMLALRTVCPVHLAALVEAPIGTIVHPIWSEFLRKHQRSHREICTIARGSSALATLANRPVAGDELSPLHQAMVVLQDSLIAHALRGPAPQSRSPMEERAAVAYDLVWALTRADCHRPDRLVYHALPLSFLSGACRYVERRDAGPAEFVRLHIDERHLVLAIVTVWTGPPGLWALFYCSPWRWTDNCELIVDHLGNLDRAEFDMRQRRWNWRPHSTI